MAAATTRDGGSVVRRSPQEKKALSYARDRRNCYGENDKSSRKNIPRRKRMRNRADRRREGLFAGAVGAVDLAAAERCEVELLAKGPASRWRKRPDVPLGEVVEWKLQRRARKAAASASSQA
ncbi:hypothetical protein [Nocardia neocaledoniensis]|uniref:hypothetical protein n=1 Tax=Nocardia neocaledoniensis TaxID=236511 RepID=UPI0011B79DFB|nr:hypothetical protein [Nocardia neocaledoniensis]